MTASPALHAAPLKVALVGFGYVGKTFHAPLIAATPGLALHTMVSSDPAKVAADFPDVRVVAELAAVLADPAIDLVVVATPNALHAPQAIAALNAGKAVVVDKPFAVTAAEAQAMAEAAKAAGKLLAVFHNRRWDSDFLTLQRLIGEGALGEIVQFESHFDRFRPVVRDRWRERPARAPAPGWTLALTCWTRPSSCSARPWPSPRTSASSVMARARMTISTSLCAMRSCA